MSLAKNMTISAVLLGLFAITGSAMVAFTSNNTAERIAANERAFLLRSLHELVTPDMHDNDMFNDVIQVTDKESLGSKKPVNIYRARKEGNNIAVIISAVAPDGYNGDIGLLIAIDNNGALMGVRVASHRETPGLGDAIEVKRSDWVLVFYGKSLVNTGKKDWRFKRYGGVFYQFTCATISPSAILKAVRKSLVYFQHKHMMLFAYKNIS